MSPVAYHVDARLIGRKRWNTCSIWDTRREAERDGESLVRDAKKPAEYRIREVRKAKS